ncbi:adenosine deaminase, partial [Lactobacillus delbrueckii subsp. bulgaricus]
EQVVTLAKNSFETSWISKEQKALYLKEIDDYVNQFNA